MAWDGAAASPIHSSLASGTGLIQNNTTTASTNATTSNTIRNTAMIGRRPATNGSSTDSYFAVSAIVDIDGDGQMEVITGTRIHKFQINSLSDHTLNTYTTIEGPTSVSVREATDNATNGTTNTTYYLNDGFTRVADIDGDGQLDILVMQNASGVNANLKILMYVWSYDLEKGVSQVKAASTIYSSGTYGTFGIPFIGDINGRSDGWDGAAYTKKLPEIVFCMGGLSANNTSARTGTPIHPSTIGGLSQNPSGTFHVPAFTYDASEPFLWRRLKLSWVLGTTDNSNMTGITMFDFNNDGAFDLCYRDMSRLRVISPKLGTSDLIPATATVANNPAILFLQTGIYSETGFEAPAIADINLDGSADIIVTGYTGAGYLANIYAFEYSGTQKWAPCPPVWNQALYNPLYINEDLTVPAFPQSMLTKYWNGTDSIQPYNGAWIQQPIVQENRDYKPVYRLPDPLITDMKVNVQTTSNTLVTLTIKNHGTATVNANTPITFYANVIGVDDFSSASIVQSSVAVGKDIFPGDVYEGTYTLTGANLNNRVVWARVMDDGTNFPAAGYEDCDTSNNLMSGIDCPYLIYNVTMVPSSVICGTDGTVILKAVNTNPIQATPTFQWYKNDILLPGDTLQTYIATDSGEYKCYIKEDLCRGFTANTVKLTRSAATGEKPILGAIPESQKVCGNNSSVYLYVKNDTAYSSANVLYYWFKDGVEVASATTNSYYYASDSGAYQVVVADISCAYISEEIEVTVDNTSYLKPIIETPNRNADCSGGQILLRALAYIPDGQTVKYQWFRNDKPLFEDTLQWLIIDIVSEGSEYKVMVTYEDSCSNFSDSLRIDNHLLTGIDKPLIVKNPDTTAICVNGSIALSVSNASAYTNPIYVWYKDGFKIDSSSNPNYIVTDEGYYFVQVLEGICSGISDQEYFSFANDTADSVFIVSTMDLYELCGPNSVITLKIKDEDVKPGDTYQWYKDGKPIQGETKRTLSVSLPGSYKLFVFDGECSYFSNTRVITQGSITDFAKPVLVKDPTTVQLCGVAGSIRIYVQNELAYSQPTYVWFKDTIEQYRDTLNSFVVYEAGEYRVEVIDGICMSLSNPLNITLSIPEIDKPEILPDLDSVSICSSTGEVILQLKDLSTYSNTVTYTWFKDRMPISGASSHTYRTNVSGYYQIRVFDGVCSALSDSIKVKISTDSIVTPVLRQIPTQSTICDEDGSIYLYVENASSYTDPVFVWYHNDTVVYTSSTEIGYNAKLTGKYYVQVKSGDCSIISQSVNLTKILDPVNMPEIKSVTDENVICGENGIVALTLKNPEDFSGITGYQWYRNGFPITNEVSDIIYISTQPGKYQLQVREGSCAAMSDTFNVITGIPDPTVNPPALAFDPDSILCVGGNIKISISNANLFPGATYYWYKDNTLMLSGSNHIYYTEQSGEYFVIVKYDGCSYVSKHSNVRISTDNITTPRLSAAPEDHTICGDSGSVVIRLTNFEDFNSPSYQWYKNDTLIVGTTNPILVVDNVLGAGEYRLRVQNGLGCVAYSDTMQVSHYASPGILKPTLTPTRDTIYPGTLKDSVLLTVGNIDPSAYQYYWYDDDELLRIDANSAPITFWAKTPGNYFVQAVYGSASQSSCGTISNIAKIELSGNLTEKPLVSQIPDSICTGDGIVILTITNTAAYTNPVYSWYNQSGTVVGNDYQFITSTPGSYYAVVLDNSTPSAPSNTHTIGASNTSITKPSLVATSKKICGSNGRAILYIEDYASNYSSGTIYQWFKDGVSVQYDTIPTYIVTGSGAYSVWVNDGYCLAKSDTIPISTSPSSLDIPTIERLGSDNLQICDGASTVILRLSNNNLFQNHKFQWFKNEIPLAGETDSLLRVTLDNVSSEIRDDYRIMAYYSDSCTSLSDKITIRAYPSSNINRPVLVRNPLSGKLCGDDAAVVLSVSNANEYLGYTYYWIKNNTQIVQTGRAAMYEVTEPGIYTVYVTGSTCSAESYPDTITESTTEIEAPLIASTTTSPDICATNSQSLLMLTSPNGTYTNPKYQWYKGDTLLSGDTLPRLRVTLPGNYRIYVTDDSCGAFSNTIAVNSTGQGSTTVPSLVLIPDNKVICKDGGRILVKVTNQSAFVNATYIWYNGNKEIQRGSSAYYYADSIGYYFVQVINQNGCSSVSREYFIDTSNNTIPLPILRSIPESNIICGENGVVVIGFTNPNDYTGASYQWYKNNEPIANENGIITGTSPELFLTVQTAGEYRLRVVNGNCATFSDTVVVRYTTGGLPTSPRIIKTPDTTVICGTNGVIMLSARDYAQYPQGTKYLWYQNNEIVQDSTIHYFEAKGMAGAGIYYLQVILSDGCASLADNIVTLTYEDKNVTVPLLTSLPTSDTICGDTGVVTLLLANDVYPAGTIYLWYKNNSPISGAYSKSLKVQDTGSYRLMVTIDEECAAISEPKKVYKSLSNMNKPMVELDPLNGQLCGSFSSILLKVKNTSAFPDNCIYTWFNGNDIVAQGINLTIYEADTIGTYYVQITDGGCATLSDAIPINESSFKIPSKPLISAEPTTALLCGTSSNVILTFTNPTDYSVDYTYQWYENNLPIASTTNQTTYYTNKEGSYRIKVYISNCAVYSDTINVKIGSETIDRPTIKTLPDPTNTVCYSGGRVLLQVAETYSNTARFKWYQGSTMIQDSTVSYYMASQAGNYHVVVKEDDCVSKSDNFRLIMGAVYIDTPIVVSLSNSFDICENGFVVLSVKENTYGPHASYQWLDSNFSPIIGAVNSSLSVNTAGRYSVLVIDGTCSSISNVVAITKSNTSIEKAKIESLPSNNTVCGDTGVVVLSISNVEDYDIASIQWYRNYEMISNNANDTLYIANEEGFYWLHIVDKDSCLVFSDTIEITKNTGVIHKPIIKKTPDANVICQDAGKIILEVSNTANFGSNSEYIWYKDYSIIQRSTNTVYEATQGGVYFVQVEDNGCSSISDFIILDASSNSIKEPILSYVPQSLNICGDNGLVIIELSNMNEYINPSIQWFFNSDSILNANNITYETTDSGSFKVLVEDNGCYAFSQTLKITKDNSLIEKPEIVSALQSGVICANETSTSISWTNSSDYTNNAALQWYMNDTVISNATNASLEVSQEGSYKLLVVDDGCAAFSNVILIRKKTYFATVEIKDSICLGEAYNFFGTSLTTTGIYNDTLRDIDGCDSIVTTLDLFVRSESIATTNIKDTICKGYSYNFNGKQLTRSGVYTDTLQTITGCDSIITLSLYVKNIAITGRLNPKVTVSCDHYVLEMNSSNVISYQWYKDGVLIPDEETDTLTLNKSQDIDGTYHVVMQDPCGEVSSKPVEVVTP